MPRLANREKREKLEPDSDALSRAKGFVQKVRESDCESCLGPDTRQKILKDFPEILRFDSDKDE